MTTDQADMLIYLAGRLEVWLMLLVAVQLVAIGWRLTSFFMKERTNLWHA